MEKLANYTKHAALTWAVFVFVATFLFGSMPRAEAFTDNDSWVNCSGRYTVRSVAFGRSSRLTVYGCNSGFFTNVSSGSYGQILAQVRRVRPYPFYTFSRIYGYAATSNMAYRVGGANYEAWGYSAEGSASVTW